MWYVLSLLAHLQEKTCYVSGYDFTLGIRDTASGDCSRDLGTTDVTVMWFSFSFLHWCRMLGRPSHLIVRRGTTKYLPKHTLSMEECFWVTASPPESLCRLHIFQWNPLTVIILMLQSVINLTLRISPFPEWCQGKEIKMLTYWVTKCLYFHQTLLHVNNTHDTCI